MGHPLKNPPVYFTVAQVRFNPLLKLADFLPTIQEALRTSGFPAFVSRPTTVVHIVINDAQSVPQTAAQDQYVFADVNNTHAFVLGADSLTLQSTDYGTFQRFSDTFLRGLALVHKVVTLSFTDRVGLRYLDHIMPKPGDELSQYLAPELLGMSTRLGGAASHSYSELLSEHDTVRRRVRVLIRDGGLAFPPDLVPDGMTVQARFMQHSGWHALLDTDGFTEGRQLFDLTTVEQQLGTIHGVIRETFEQAITPHAKKTWDE